MAWDICVSETAVTKGEVVLEMSSDIAVGNSIRA